MLCFQLADEGREKGQVELVAAKTSNGEYHLNSHSTGQKSVTGAHFPPGRLGNGSGSVPTWRKSWCLMNP